MCTMQQCQQYVGEWVRFQTPLGQHRGVVEQVRGDAALIRVPRTHAPLGLASLRAQTDYSDEQKIDAVLAQWAFGGPGGPGGPGYRPGFGAPGYPPAYGPPGYGAGWWARGWWFWWIPFFAILALAFLW